jgi:hypothetical protein
MDLELGREGEARGRVGLMRGKQGEAGLWGGRRDVWRRTRVFF